MIKFHLTCPFFLTNLLQFTVQPKRQNRTYASHFLQAWQVTFQTTSSVCTHQRGLLLFSGLNILAVKIDRKNNGPQLLLTCTQCFADVMLLRRVEEFTTFVWIEGRWKLSNVYVEGVSTRKGEGGEEVRTTGKREEKGYFDEGRGIFTSLQGEEGSGNARWGKDRIE